MRTFIIALIFAVSLVLTGHEDSYAQSEAFAQHAGFTDPGSRSVAGGSGGLVPVEGSVDGGAIPIGATAQVVIRFRNEGSQPVQTGLIRLYPSSNIAADVSMNQCQDGALPTGAECAIALSVKALQAGAWRVEMLMSHSGRTRLVTATVAGSIEAGAEGAEQLSSDIEAVPGELDFGTLSSSQTLVEPIVLRNITSNAIEVSDVYINTSERAGYALKTDCESLQAGQACIAVISWSPNLTGRSSGVLVIKHTGPSGLTSVPLSGEYTPDDVSQAEVFPQAVPGKGLLVSSQTEVDFGADITTASTITVSLVNAGDAPLTLNNVSFSGSDNGLDFKEGGCEEGLVLEPIEACPLTVHWSPTRIGNLYDDIQVRHTGARGVLVLPVRGVAASTVSKDQKAIVLSDRVISSTGSIDTPRQSQESAGRQTQSAQPARQTQTPSSSMAQAAGITNPASVLDGYRITSFSPSRAIINGPGGSRLVFDGEEAVIGGIPWFIMIQPSGIEFLYEGQRVLLLFDKSLSSINRVSASSGGGGGSSAQASGGAPAPPGGG